MGEHPARVLVVAACLLGIISRAEAVEELREWDELDAAIAPRRALLRRVVEDGAVVLRRAR